jgi:MoaA/NifB/PqqE/SkfB family radical SAM enzyme
MCDIWKANVDKREITVADLAPHLDVFRRLGVKRIVLSGGEPLMHSNLWAFCDELKALDVRITLLSTGLLLERHSQQICSSCDEVIVSLDGSPEVHNTIRNIPLAYEKLKDGVRALRAVDNGFRVTGRSVLQRQNYYDILNIVQAARDIGLDSISFLAADVSTPAFNRPVPWTDSRTAEITLDESDIERFKLLIEQVIEQHDDDIRSGFIAESAEKLRRLPAYFAGIKGLGALPSIRCNAPWVSAVIEADGTVRPCFFHQAFGNIYRQPFDAILNSPGALSFRRNLNVATDSVCQRCVCTLYLNPLAKV